MKISNIVRIGQSIVIAGAFIFSQSIGVSPALANLVDDQILLQNPQNVPSIAQPTSNFQVIQQVTPSAPVIILAMGSSNTSKVTGTINRGKNQCASVPAEYQADCLSQTFRSAARVSNGMVDYTRAGKELGSANKQIDALVSKNLDKSAPTIRKGGRTLRAVKKTAIAKVSTKTKKIIATTASKLIRAAGKSEKRKIHFSRIAKAVDSTKVILRSA